MPKKLRARETGMRINSQSISESSSPFSTGQADRKGTVEQGFAATLPVGELIQYWCAVAVSEESHFTRAARRLHMDQSAVSRHIQKLESKLGLRLFVRSGRGAELTDAGKGFIPHARKSLASARTGERLAQAIAVGDPQELEVAYSPAVDLHLIAQIQSLIAGARARLPIRFRSVAAETLAERLFEGTSHAAIGILPVDDEIAKACILRERLFVALPNNHRFAQENTIHAGQLGDDPVIWASGARHAIAANHLMDLFRRAGYVPNVTREAQCIAEALGLVREGFGVAFVKASALQLHPEGLVFRPLSETYLVVETGLLYLAERRWEFLKEFVSLVTHHLRCDDRISNESPVS